MSEQNKRKKLRIPDPKDFDPRKVDGSKVPIKDITQPGRAIQIIGGVRAPAPRMETPKPKPPFRVDSVDQFEGYCEDGYGTIGSFDKIEDAIAEARRITEEGIKWCGGYDQWDGMGDAGLVYDATGRLVWSGIEFAVEQHKQKCFGYE